MALFDNNLEEDLNLIFLCREGHVKLTDFGCVKESASDEVNNFNEVKFTSIFPLQCSPLSFFS